MKSSSRLLFGTLFIVICALVLTRMVDPTPTPTPSPSPATAEVAAPAPAPTPAPAPVDEPAALAATATPQPTPTVPPAPADSLAKAEQDALAAIPAGELKSGILNLSPAARTRALTKLRRIEIPREDFASLRIAADGTLYYVNDIPPPAAEHPHSQASLRPDESHQSAAIPAPGNSAAAAVPISAPPERSSRPGSTNVIYLDFNGQTITGTGWNSSVATYVAKPYDTDGAPTTFSDDEQSDIIKIWERVAEDYAPFDVNVTTIEPLVFTNTTAHALITSKTDANGQNMPSHTSGGVAKLDVFGESNFASHNSPAFVYFDNFSGNEANIAEAVSHEVGHNMGLTHDGQTGVEYYGGHGSGDTSWGPIMGTGYGQNVSQWSKGEYFNANNPQDDLLVMQAKMGYATDEAGGTIGTAAAASVSGSSVAMTGVLAHVNDLDLYAVTTASGTISFSVAGFRAASGTHGGNTDFKLELLDAAGSVVATHAPAGATNATLTHEATAGNYFVRLSADGDGTPLANPPSGYTAYGSAGQYTLTGTIIAAAPGITSTSTAAVDAGAPFTYSIVATNAPTAYGATGLPAGLSLDADTGLISGRATATGVFEIPLSATNSLGTGTGSLSLTVNDAAPAITAQSGRRIVLTPGADQTLSVTALSANGAPTYQWERDGRVVTGATTSTLDLTAVTPGTSGTYRVRITNTVGTTLSDPIFVRVAPAATEVLVWGDDGQGMTTIPSGLDDAVDLALGYEFAVALRADGSLVAWGSDSSGQATAPAEVTDAVRISAGSFHALALKSDGTVVGWGNDFYDQATPPSGLTGVVDIAAGGDASIALRNDGTVVAWGRTTYGQTSVPDGLSNVVAIAMGNFHALALKADGSVIAWGTNANGQTTVPVTATNVIAIGAGREYSVALKSDGTLLHWGRTAFGLASPPNAAGPFTTVAAGDYHAVTLNASGSLYSWGYNIDGQRVPPLDLGAVFAADASRSNSGIIRDANLNTGPTLTSQPASRQTFAAGATLTLTAAATGTGDLAFQWYRNGRPVSGATAATFTKSNATFTDAGVYTVIVTDDHGARRSAPAHVLYAPAGSSIVGWGLNSVGQTTIPDGVDDAIAISAGTTHALALKADGTVVAWGSNDDGEATVPANLTDVVQIAAGEDVSYAVKADGTVAVWGADNFGGGAPPVGLNGVIDLDIETYHALALRADGTVIAWGNSGSGQTIVPPTLAPAVDVAVGENTSFAVHADGSVTAWGYDGNGEASVPTGINAVTVDGGSFHALALKDDGTVAGWGFAAMSNAPGGLGSVIAISAGAELSVALKADRSIAAWGSTNSNGERVPPGGLDTVFGISAGDGFALALQEVEVPAAPVITTPPTAQTVNAGASVSFNVSATGVPAPTYQWRKDTVAISGATGTTYTITETAPVDTGSYDVVATNASGSATSDPATLTVQFAPAITTPPQSQTVTSGATVNLTVVATGLPAPTYQWRKDGEPITGATSATLMLQNVSLTDAANYDVVVTNVVDSVTSSTAIVTVQTAPAISAQPQSQTVDAGSSVTFTVSASGVPAPTYQWRKDGEPIADATAASFTLASTTPADAGSYDVVVTNSVSAVPSATATLTVNYRPAFTSHPLSQTALVGAEVTFTAAVTGVPTPTSFQWLKGSQPITGANSTTLVLNAVTLDDAGDYALVAGNTLGTTRSDFATLTVQAIPAISAQPAAQTTVLAGTNVTLTATATGTPTPNLQWQKNGTDIDGATSGSLALNGVTLDDAATYTMVATNVVGTATTTDAVLTVAEISGTQSTTGYTAGETITISNTVTYAGPLSQLRWSVIPPDAIGEDPWSFASTSGTGEGMIPEGLSVDLLEWTWTTVPTSPFTFTYTLNVPPAAVGDYQLSTMVEVISQGTTLQGHITPEPLTLTEPVTWHSADYDEDFAINLSELLRVIELYNTRFGTSRTGRYQEQSGTVDGYSSDASQAASQPTTVTRFHSADSDRDGSISLPELLRVIELYNTRSGSTRTGQYHVDPGTPDGFAAGPATP